MPAASDERRPNILLIMTDQQRGDCLGVEDHPVLLTPNMDSIAGSGTRFSSAYSTCPVCIPARRSMMSGKYPGTHGVIGFNETSEWDAAEAMPSYLRAAGYHTFLVGRSMHMYPATKRYGFDHMVDHHSHYREWINERIPVRGYQRSGEYWGTGPMHNDWTARSWPHDDALHHTNWTVDEALRFLRNRDPSCPYFLVVSFLAPHPPLNPPAFYMDRYLRQDMPPPVIGDWAEPPPNGGKGRDVSDMRVDLTGEALRSAQAGYYGLINHIDDQMRRLLTPVEDPIDRDNTVILFTSDHGEMLGDHHFFRKSLPYEGAARIPMLASAPPRFGFPQGQIIDRPVALEDTMPTALDFAGIDIPDEIDGQSMVPFMRGDSDAADGWRDHLHIEHGGDMNDLPHHTLTDGNEKFIWFSPDGREQFFDLGEDPTECRNLIDSPAHQDRISHWRNALIGELAGRPEGMSDGERLIAGRPHPDLIPASGQR